MTESYLGRESLSAVGIMTGNSMDGVDVVLSEFSRTGTIRDIESHSEPFPEGLAELLRAYRTCLNEAGFDIAVAESAFESSTGSIGALNDAHERYLVACARAVTSLLEKAAQKLGMPPSVDVVGFHGQTLGHMPPSIARTKSALPFTIQFGDGQRLADLLNIPVVFDFRSDDVMSGGEGAPLAPMHHNHLAADTMTRGYFPIAFVNAGNTGNISIITKDLSSGNHRVIGWDTGPFNHFPDLLARRELHAASDENGAIGATGKLHPALLRLLFTQGAVTKDGANFLLQPPPRSSDPQWYREIPELLGLKDVEGIRLSLADRMRTAEYFSAYAVMFALSYVPDTLAMPGYFALCGGGWKNPVARGHFEALLSGDESLSPILEEHRHTFAALRERLPVKQVRCDESSSFGYDGTAMEARIFADAAVSRLVGAPFTTPETTAVSGPCICGALRFPRSGGGDALLQAMRKYGTLETRHAHVPLDTRFGRAVPKWQEGVRTL